jgi:hypothetical protein
MSGDSPAPARTISLVKDPTGAPAVNLSKVREAGHIDLVKRAEKAGISLSKRNLSGLRGAVRLYVDHSGSMEFPDARDYSNGNVQRLVERALGYAFQLDSDGQIPVIAFDSELWPEVIVDQRSQAGTDGCASSPSISLRASPLISTHTCSPPDPATQPSAALMRVPERPCSRAPPQRQHRAASVISTYATPRHHQFAARAFMQAGARSNSATKT